MGASKVAGLRRLTVERFVDDVQVCRLTPTPVGRTERRRSIFTV